MLLYNNRRLQYLLHVATRGGAVGAGEGSRRKNLPQLSVKASSAEGRGTAGTAAPNFGLQDNICTVLQCCCREHTRLFMLHFYIFWTSLWCSPSTWTPVMSSGGTESQAACSGFLLPCTGSWTRIKECEWCLLFIPLRLFCKSAATLWEAPHFNSLLEKYHDFSLFKVIFIDLVVVLRGHILI